MNFKFGDRILFFGDSITDCHRDRHRADCLGRGYALMASARLQQLYPDLQLEFINRGISGDRTSDLLRRLQTDCLDLEPDQVILFVGINDCTNYFYHQQLAVEEAVEEFKDNYRNILCPILDSGASLSLMEPFVLPCPSDRYQWRTFLNPMNQSIRQLAREYKLTYVPLDGHLNALGIAGDFNRYTQGDGVHPTPLGHLEIADQLLRYIR